VADDHLRFQAVPAFRSLAVQRDATFIPPKTLSAYADEARERGLIQG
jgi:Protein of unknown function (DUF2958)